MPLIRGQLFGIQPTDLVTLASVIVLFLFVAAGGVVRAGDSRGTGRSSASAPRRLNAFRDPIPIPDPDPVPIRDPS